MPGRRGRSWIARFPGNQSPAHLLAPTAALTAPSARDCEFWVGARISLRGLTFHNQRRDADGGNQLSLRLLDQGLCVGNGEVIEPVNDLFTTYDAATKVRTGAYESLSQFFFGVHEIDGTKNPPVFGLFISDLRS